MKRTQVPQYTLIEISENEEEVFVALYEKKWFGIALQENWYSGFKIGEADNKTVIWLKIVGFSPINYKMVINPEELYFLDEAYKPLLSIKQNIEETLKAA